MEEGNLHETGSGSGVERLLRDLLVRPQSDPIAQRAVEWSAECTTEEARGGGAYKFRWSMAIVSLPTAGMYTLACKRKRKERESVLSDIVQKRGEGKEG